MSNSYTITRTKHGITVEGSLPISDLVALSAAWAEEGHTEIDPGISQALRVVLAVASPERCVAWRAEIEKNNAHLNKEVRWLHGTDTGLSSKAIFAVLAEPSLTHGMSVADVPLDSDDFGRCRRLVDAMGWRPRLPEVAARNPRWAPLVEAWDELVEMHRARAYTQLTERMRVLNGRTP